MNQHSENTHMSFQDAHGELPYGMTNDYMFRAVLQSNNKVLRGLICSLLHLAESEVNTVVITNPIVLGADVADKEFRLDINVILNNKILINLEMQVTNRLNWRNRSVMYLCRSFDQLNHGQDYGSARPAVHIGLLDYTLFIEQPEFYASYKLINLKTHQSYSDGLTLNVLDLTRIDLATEEDKKYRIHEWARLFKATTWEEINMLASKDEYLQEAAETIFRMSADDLIRKRCREREEHYQDLRNYERKIEEDKRNYERQIEQNKHNYERQIEQDKRNYERQIEQDKRNYERQIEQDKRNYEKQIEQLRAEIEALKQQPQINT